MFSRRLITYGESVVAHVGDVFAVRAGSDAKGNSFSGEGHTRETLEFSTDHWASVLQLSLIELLALAVEARVDDLEPDIVTFAAESRRDVGTMTAVVDAVDGAVAIVRAFHHDCELGVRLEAAGREGVEEAEHSCV